MISLNKCLKTPVLTRLSGHCEIELTALIPISFCMTTDHCLADPAVPCPAAIRTLILGAAANDDDAASIIISDDYRIILHRRD